MKTEVVLKSDPLPHRMNVLPLFNENRSCIEIIQRLKQKKNNNMFNENRSCIEIRILQLRQNRDHIV